MKRPLTSLPLVILLSFLYACSATHKNHPSLENDFSLNRSTSATTENSDIASSSLDNEESRSCLPHATDNEISDSNSYHPTIKNALNLCDTAQSCWQRKETGQAIKALDKAYMLIIKFDAKKDKKLIKQKEELRFLISKRIYEIYASRNTVVSGPNKAIPMEMNNHVRAEIDFLTKGRFMKESYKRSGRYREFIAGELKKAGLPSELSWLPLIESGYRVNALSPARALGLWQFIPSTGYKFGLKRDRYVDERLDPVKSTQAAIAYLKELHQIFGDWSTVLAAYNCGEGRVLQVIRSQNVNYLDNFWDLYEKLPRETARYVPRFLATLHIVSQPKKYGIDKLKSYKPYEYDTVVISKQIHLKDIAENLKISKEHLNNLNPELRQNVLPPGNYALKIPKGKKEPLLASLESIPVASPPKSAPLRCVNSKTKYVYYKVRRGDTLSKIARRYKTSVKKIRQANNLSKRSRIYTGKKLRIPVRYANRSSSKSYSSSHSSWKKTSKYVVKKGDTLWTIADKYGTSTSALKKANKVSGKHLKIGQALIVPKKSSTSAKRASTSLKTYKVKNGDVPMAIAKRHNMSLERFLKVNKMTSKSRIYPGQKVYVE